MARFDFKPPIKLARQSELLDQMIFGVGDANIWKAPGRLWLRRSAVAKGFHSTFFIRMDFSDLEVGSEEFPKFLRAEVERGLWRARQGLDRLVRGIEAEWARIGGDDPVDERARYSVCCGVEVSDWEHGVCPACQEHCSFTDEEAEPI